MADAADPEIVLSILGMDDREELGRLLDQHPTLLDPATIAELDRFAASPDFGAPIRAVQRLLRMVPSDAPAAFAEFQSYMVRAQQTGARLDQAFAEINEALVADRPEEARGLIGAAMQDARSAGLGLAVGALHGQNGRALLRLRSGDRVQNVEDAIAAFEAALELTTEDESLQAADALMHLGLAHAQRGRGDRFENLERAVEILRAALAAVAGEDLDLRAMIETNLATALLRREAGDALENVNEAVELCSSALRHRSPRRHPNDWAYSQLTLGAALERLVALDASALATAEAAYQPVFEAAAELTESWLVGAAHSSLGRLYRGRARLSAEAIVDAHDEGRLDDLFDTKALYARANAHYEAALPLLESAPDQNDLGRALSGLADVAAEMGDDERAIEAGTRALTILKPASAPHAALDAARDLGAVYARRAEWAEAAAAYRIAVQASESIFHRRSRTTSREDDVRAIGNLHRWASFALAKSGSPEEAATVLETGRTRELRRRFGVARIESDQLARLPTDLRRTYITAAEALAAAPMGQAGETAAIEYQRVLEEIRLRPGLERFGMGASNRDLVEAVEPGWPLLFVNPTPMGTMLLALQAGETAGPSVTVTFLEHPTSEDVYFRLLAGPDAARGPDEAEGAASYLFAISGEGDARPQALHEALDDLLPWLGENIARPMMDLLTTAGASGVTLVLCGPVGAAPLHAASWSDGSAESRCLLDYFDVRFAPSAIAAATASGRAMQRPGHDGSLVALGDPTNDLPLAGPEVEAIGQLLPEHRVHIETGREATSAFLRQHAGAADYLHLACHGRAGLFDGGDSAVLLSDGWLSALDLAGVPQLDSRLVVVSACYSGLSELAGLPDEAFSLGVAVVAAGSACAIVSLWPVDDAATALLMARFYEELIGTDTRPPEALSRAQRWMRELSDDHRDAFIDRHPSLVEGFRRRALNGHPVENLSLGHPDYWAAFVAIGV